MIKARQALAALEEGNRRFVEGTVHHVLDAGVHRREALVEGQAPCAVVLGCSDSRVPPEVVFDQRLGELFVVRVAGNIANPSQVGSAVFGVEVLGARLVVVMGHTGCGAVGAALRQVLGGTTGSGAAAGEGLAAVVDPIRPAVEEAVAAAGVARIRGANAGPAPEGWEALSEAAVAANVRAQLARVRAAFPLGVVGSPESLAWKSDGVLVLGAVYHVESGHVRFLAG
ncbi:MAG: carbonic anhydrase [Longimicrobiales bacterium]|nr:carbonic anhydrase [Longimicrobiales bacterium]